MVLVIAHGLSLHPLRAAAMTPGVPQPRSIRELADSIDHTLKGLLTGEERQMFSTMSPEQIKTVRPQLYARIRRDVWGWTTEERKGMDYLLEEMVRRSIPSRPVAVELLLAAYLSGNQETMEAIFGADAWNRVVALGGSKKTWRTHRIARALSSPQAGPSPIDNR